MAALVYSSLNPCTIPLHLHSHLSFSAQLRAVSTTAAAPIHNLRVLIAAGGTGGHIYPAIAIAIADHLKTFHPNANFLFVGTPTGMASTNIKWAEAKAVPSAGFPFTTAPAAPSSLSTISSSFPSSSLTHSSRISKSCKNSTPTLSSAPEASSRSPHASPPPSKA